MDGTRSSSRTIDMYALVPILACIYATIVFPLIIASCSPTDSVCLLEARPESKIFWPALALISLIWAASNYTRLSFPPLILWLFACLAFAGLSVTWAFKPEISFVRFAQQAMIITAIVIPAMLAGRGVDLMRGLFICFAIAAVLNLVAVFTRPPIDVKFATWGYPGYFSGKNYLGEFAVITFLLSLHEMLYAGWRRASGIVIAIITVALLIASNSKTSMGLVVLAPLLAGMTLLIRKKTGLSPAIILLSIPVGWWVFSTVTGFTVYRLSNILYGDPTFTGRSIIWDFVRSEIDHRPLFGWGYQSFWLVGPDAPSIVNAPGWVKDMPNAHNGYLDTMVELGYAGYALLLAFIIATLHAIGRIADRAPLRAWLVLALAVHIIITNGLESLWMRGFEMLWIVFVILAAEAARYWRAAPARARQLARSGKPSPAPRRPAAGVRLHPAHAANLARAAFSTTAAPGTPDGSAPTPRN
jgi:exopolysaccharide production protein ExoQ